jgi:arginyl-tRNA synthetase
MQLCEIFTGLGHDNLNQLLRGVSMGKLKTYQLFDRVKTRLHLGKLNQENLRKAGPRIFTRLEEKDEELALDLSQAILVSHLDMIVAVLDHLGVPHNDGFFEKDANLAAKLTGDWQQKTFEQFRDKYPPAILAFYLNHLAHEVDENSPLFQAQEA